jgi:Peptidyl-tRNA hydrolase PTH2
MSSVADTTATNDDEVPKLKRPIVQYIVLRRDLDWPTGAMAAQAAHASLAAVAEGLQHQHAPTQAYISPSNLPHMTKYVYGVDSLPELEAVRDAWKEFGESYYWWVEQPENEPSAFATWPVERTNQASKLIKNMKLTFF